jgi:hypothetical protein
MFGLALVGCVSGDDSNQTNPNPNGHVCGATLAITGSFAADPSAPPPAMYTGCWGAGTWTFAASIVNNDCSQTPALQPSYVFQAQAELDMNGDPIVDKFPLVMPDPSTVQSIVKISELGNAMCEGEVDLYSPDGTQVWEFRPDLQQAVNNTLTGQGTFDIYTTNQWPY